MKNIKNSFILIRGGWPYVQNIEPLLAKKFVKDILKKHKSLNVMRIK